MCVSPTRIRNPNYGLSHLKGKDTVSAYINVPCGHCPECIAIRQMSYVQRLLMEETCNHLFYCTLTYNNESLPHYECSSGRKIRYADVSDIQNMIKRLRKYNSFGRPFRYFCVSELGSARGRPHFHLIWIVKKYDGDDYGDIMNLESVMFRAVLKEWRRNYGSRRCPDYRPCCTYVRRFVRGKLRSTYDLHYILPQTTLQGASDVAFYVTKYMLKPSDRERRLQQALRLNLDPLEYDKVWSVVRPRCFSSLGLGLNGENTPFGIEPDPRIVSYVKDCVRRSKVADKTPKFFNPHSGRSFPLSRFYRTKFYCYSGDDYNFFNSLNPDPDNVVYDDTDLSVKVSKVDRHKSRLRDSFADDSSIFNELLDDTSDGFVSDSDPLSRVPLSNNFDIPINYSF